MQMMIRGTHILATAVSTRVCTDGHLKKQQLPTTFSAMTGRGNVRDCLIGMHVRVRLSHTRWSFTLRIEQKH